MSKPLRLGRRRFLCTATAAVAASCLGITGCMVQQKLPATDQLPIEGTFPAFEGATAWLNSPPLTAADLRGKSALVNFGTYTCINWLRTLPYIRGWAEKYKGHGLEVITVHTPEFAFEHTIENVRSAVQERQIEHPVVIDNDYTIWNGFNNSYWPAFYLVDAQGRMRHHQFGEGNYERLERAMQQLLTQAGASDIGAELLAVEGSGVEAAPDLDDLQSAENYVGYARTEHVASPGGLVYDTRHTYAVPTQVRLHQWGLGGDWTAEQQKVVGHTANGRIVNRFHARDLHLVMGPPASEAPVRFRVLVDGQPPGAAHGSDVDEQGNGLAREQRLYQLIRQQQPITDRLFEIEFLDPGIEAYSFTFG